MDMIAHMKKISSGQTFTDMLNLCCDLDLECSNPIFQQDTLSYDAILPNQIWLQTNQQFRRYNRKSYFDYISPRCDLDIEHNEPIFLHDTLWLMRLHYHNRFGNKIFCGSDNTVGTVFTDILNLHCDLDLECSSTHFTTEYSSL